MTRCIIFLSLICTLSCVQRTSSTEQELIDVEQAFCNMSAEEGMKKAFQYFADEEVVLLDRGSLPILGKEAMMNALSAIDDSNFTLTWQPVKAEIAASGDLGYTYGNYQRIPADSGESIQYGTYVTIWKKNAEGEWRYVLDTGQEGPAD